MSPDDSCERVVPILMTNNVICIGKASDKDAAHNLSSGLFIDDITSPIKQQYNHEFKSIISIVHYHRIVRRWRGCSML